MTLIQKIKNHLSAHSVQAKDTDPEKAYDLWSQSYDVQTGNLMLALDNTIFSFLLDQTDLKNKKIVDIGCGTGRHWQEIFSKEPKNLSGYDVSIGMLSKLRKKYPDAVIGQLHSNYLPALGDASKDIIISTLTIAHIEDVAEAFREWYRVLNKNGEIIITDYHPAAFINGGDRTFSHAGRKIAIKNHIHPIDRLLAMMYEIGFELVSFIEKKVDDSMKHYYEEKQAMHVFEKFKNIPIIYGMHLKKINAAS